MNIEIKDLDTGLEFNTWMTEKLNKAIMMSFLAKEQTIDKNAKESIRMSLRYLLKIKFALRGKNDNDGEWFINLFLNNDHKFFEKYINLATSTDFNKEERFFISDHKVFEDVKCLITKEQNRTLLEEKLQQYENERINYNSWIKELQKDLEFVHQGQKKWKWFYEKHVGDQTPYTVFSYKELLKLAKEEN